MISKPWILIVCLMMGLASLGQTIDFPIANETPVRGIYQNFEEFKFNRPGIVDSFYLEYKLREQGDWRNTLSYTPIYADSDMPVKNVWGFSAGGKVYIYKSREYFEINLDSGIVGFYGYGEVGTTGVGIASVAGGMIGGVLYGGVASLISKTQRIYYYINPFNGRPNTTSIFNDLLETTGITTTKLIIYRTGKKELDIPLKISIDDSLNLNIIPYSVEEIEFPMSRTPCKICYGAKMDSCFNVFFIKEEPLYLKASIPAKSGAGHLIEVEQKVGEYYTKQALYFQNKREEKE